ncbi:hypothetical protein B0H19DRAFT_1114388 [Mycena capillaripes]|nr:hypothetical protein B0H19DRAFT_1114388 [Mycena capillaripes]
MSDTLASSTAVEIRVQLPEQASTSLKAAKISEDSPTSVETSVYKKGVVRRGPKKPISDLESGAVSGDSVDRPKISARALDIHHAMLSLGSRCGLRFLAFLSAVCTNILLFRRPLAYASELKPILQQARNCREEARHFLCAWDRQPTSASLPVSLLSLQRSWERYLEGKITEWSSCSYGAGIFMGFVLGALQIAEKNDPLTRVLAFIAFSVLAFSLVVNQLLVHHLSHRYVKDMHYAYHLLRHEDSDAELSSVWNMHSVLSMSSVSTWWAIILSVFTFGSVFYHDTKSAGSSADSETPLNHWEMVTSRAVMVVICLISTSCLLWIHVTLKRYAKTVDHGPLPREIVGSSSRVVGVIEDQESSSTDKD